METKEIIKPDFVTEEHLKYLDWLRESGQTNMFGATPYLIKKFNNLGRDKAEKVLFYWMKSFSERHPQAN